jgi:hypothetical protein
VCCNLKDDKICEMHTLSSFLFNEKSGLVALTNLASLGHS